MNPDVERLKTLAETPVQTQETARIAEPPATSDTGGRKSGGVSAEQLVSLAKDSGLYLFHDQYQEGYAWVVVREFRHSLKIYGKPFQEWLVRLAWITLKKAPSREALQSASQILAASARYDAPEHPLGPRVMRTPEAIWYDLGREVVRITASGWDLVPEPFPLFLRYKHQRSQVAPVPGGDIQTFLDFINLPRTTSSLSLDQLLLLVSTMLMIIPDIAHPVLCIHAEKGSGKTTLLRMLRELVDPSVTPTGGPPDSVREFVQLASHHYLVFFDNLSTLPEWLSDALCRCVTGEGYSKRELYSNDEDMLYSYRRSIAINGVNLVPSKPDLLDRAIILSLERIPETRNRRDEQLWEHFHVLKASLLGAIFTLVSQVLALVPTVTVTRPPRLADFATYGMAATKALGLREDLFLEALRANSHRQATEALQASPIAEALLFFLEQLSGWSGTPTALLTELNKIAEQAGVNQKNRLWPKEVRWVWRRIKEVRPDLLAAGWQADHREVNGKAQIELTRRPPENDASVPISPIQPSMSGDQTGDITTDQPNMVLDDSAQKVFDSQGLEDTGDSRNIFPASTGVDSTGWPNELPGRGSREMESRERCHSCEEGTWQRYGGLPLCKRHALEAFANMGRSKTCVMNSDRRKEREYEGNHEKGADDHG
jgi:hypothetical protein